METAKRERRREDDEEEGKDEAASELPNLPPEIIREIFLRLPAKSVGRFRCVSKLFLSLFSDPGFARTHLDLALREDAVRSDSRRLIMSSHNLYAVDYDWIREKGEGNWDLVAEELNYPLKDEPNFFSELMKGYVKGKYLYCGRSEDEDEYPVMVHFDSQNMLCLRNWVDIVGSCNGLVCISPADGAVFMFNPTNGESKRIPCGPETLCSVSEEGGESVSYGFGFDASSDDYKLVNLVSADALNAWVYSLRKNSWKHLGDLGYDCSDSCYTSGVLLNGAIHWVVSLEQDHKRIITAFDLSREEFRDMPLPDEAEGCSHRFRDFMVGVLNGCLCVVNSCHEMHDDIWIMQEYGVAKSWTRIRMNVWYRFMKPICSARNGEVLLELDGGLVLYNFENHTSKNLTVRGVQLSGGFEADAYVESLISPNSFGRAITQ